MVEQAESFLLDQGFGQLRVRVHGSLARIELSDIDFARVVDPKMRKKLNEVLGELGFPYVTLDLQGYRMGSMNETLKRE